MPLDTRIALGGQPLQVQYRDPIASYNQLAQLTSADTQNQLAQMQMQEHQQMAPYRMQEQQARAATNKLTLDQAIEAQTFVKSIMDKAAEHPEAPSDPMDAAMQMLQHPNPQVQAIGGHLLDASQKLMAYKQQAQFMKDESAAPVPAGLPVAVAPSVDNVAAPMGMASAGIPASKFVMGTKDTPEGGVGPYFSIAGQPVSEKEFLLKRDGVIAKPVNGLAAVVAPEGVTAPAVNAMIPAVANALQDAAALKKEIEKGDRTYGSAPGWKSKRELLVEAYKQALKPQKADSTFAAINPSDYTPESVKAFLVSKNYGDLVAKAGKAEKEASLIANVNPNDYTPASLKIFAVSKDYGDLVAKAGKAEKEASLIANVNPNDYTPASLKIFAVSKDYGDLVRNPSKADQPVKLIANVNPSDYTPESVRAFSLSSDYGDLVLKPSKADKADKTISNINPDSYTPASVQAFALSGNYNDLVRNKESAGNKIIANVNPNDFTTASIQKFAVTGNYNDLVRIPEKVGGGGEKPVTGTIQVLDPTDPTGKRVILVTQAQAVKDRLTPASSAKEANVPQAYRDRADKLQNVYDSVSNYARVLDTYKPGDILNPQKRGQFSTAHATALLQAKELFNLGVLNGGDEVILNKVLASPVDFSAMTIPIATIKQQVADLKGVIDRSNRNLAKTYKQDVVPLNTGAEPAPAAAASSAMSAADAIINKGRR
jgi:hypothetical protein